MMAADGHAVDHEPGGRVTAADLDGSENIAPDVGTRISAEDLRRHQRMLKLLADAEQLEAQMKQLGGRRAASIGLQDLVRGAARARREFQASTGSTSRGEIAKERLAFCMPRSVDRVDSRSLPAKAESL